MQVANAQLGIKEADPLVGADQLADTSTIDICIYLWSKSASYGQTT